MNFFQKKKRPKNRALGFESLEQREFLSVSPLTYPYDGEYDTNSNTAFVTEATFAKPIIADDDVTSTTIELSWDASQFTALRKTDPFKIERQVKNTKGELVWEQIGKDIPYSYTIGDGIYRCELTGLTALTEYTLRVTFSSTALGTVSTGSETVTTKPSEIDAEAVSSTEIKLSWAIVGKRDTYYEVYTGTGGAAPTNTGQKVKADGTAAAKTITIKNLDPAREYTFYLKYYDTESKTQQTQTVTCLTRHTLSTDVTTADSAELYWSKSVGGSNYQLQICEGKPGSESDWKNATQVKVTSGGTFDYAANEKYKISDLESDKSYYFRLRYNTVNGDGETETLYTDPLIFSTPTNITVDDVTDATAKVDWVFTGKSGMPYYVQTKVNGVWTDYPGANTTGKTYTLKNLDSGTKYEIRLRYTSEEGTAAYSAEQTITTRVPTELDSVTEKSVGISWDIPNKQPGRTVSIQRCDGSLNPETESNWRTIKTGIADGTTTHTINYLGADKEYYFRVVYTDTDGEEQSTLFVAARTCGIVNVDEFTNDSVALSWDFTPKDNNYKVQMALADSPNIWSTIPVDQIKTDKSLGGCKITGLKPAQGYVFRVLYTPRGGTEELTSPATEEVWTVSSNIVVAEKEETSLTVSWAPSGFSSVQAKDFVVYYYEDSDRDGAREWKSITIGATQNSAKISNLLADTDYQIKVGYVGGTVDNAESGSTVLVARTEAHHVTVSSITKDSARLTWSFDTFPHSPNGPEANGDGKGVFTVQRYIGPNAEPTEAERNLNDDTLWEDEGSTTNYSAKYYNLTGLATNSTQYYRVVYTYSTGEPEEGAGTTWDFPQATKYSEIVEVKTASDIRAASTGTNSIRLEWDSVTLTGGSKYTVQRRVAGTTTWTSYTPTTATNFSCDNLAADTEYEFQVLFNASGGTAILKVSTARYTPSVVDRVIGIDSASATLQMSCGAGDSNFQAQYRLKTAKDSEPWTTPSVTPSVAGGKVTAIITNLIPEAEYEFRFVYTSNAASVESDVVAVPLSDSLVFGDATGHSVAISWNHESFPDRRSGTDYRVEWREVGSNAAWSKGEATQSTSFSVTKLDPNKEYEFRLQYSTVGGETAYSAVKTMKTTQPTISAGTPQVGAVKIAWNFDSYGNAGFEIQCKIDGVWYTAMTVANDKTHEAVVTKITTPDGVVNLDPEREYTFRVAYKTSQSGANLVYSEETKATTLGGMQVVENSATTTTLTVKWDFVTDGTFAVQYREAGTTNWIKTISDIPGTQKEQVITDLSPGVEYEIQLIYTDGAPQEVNITAKTTVAPPAAPTGLVADNLTEDSVTIKWFDNTAFEDDYYLKVVNNVTGMVLFDGPVGKKIGSSDPANAATKAEHALTGLDTNASYTATLYAKNAEGASSIATVTFSTKDVARPNAVTSLKAATTPRTISLSWKIKSIEDIPDPTQFRVEYKFVDPDTKKETWYELAGLTVSYNADTETYSVTISNSLDYGDGLTTAIEVKKSYSLRVVALGFVSGGETYGDSTPAAVNAATKAITVPSSLSASEITLTSAKIKFTDSDTNVPVADKVYTLYYVEGKYTDWAKVPADAVIKTLSIAASDVKTKYHVIDGLLAGTTYSYRIEWTFAGTDVITSKPATFTTKVLPKPSSVKTGFTLTADGNLATQISWKPPAGARTVPISADTVITYFVELSLNGKAGTFVLLSDSMTLSTSPKGLTYGAVAFKYLAMIAKTLPGGVDITALKALSIRVGATFTENGTAIGTAYSSNGRITVPKFQ